MTDRVTLTGTAEHLSLVVRHWGDLAEALGTSTVTTWPPAQLRTYLRELDRADAEHVAGLRHLERDPDQIGATRPPLRIDVLDTMRVVQAALVDTADCIAANVQRPTMSAAPRTWPAVDRARRDQLAAQDAADPRRWRYNGTRTAPQAATWLRARLAGGGGPCRALTAAERECVARAARGAAERIERILDLGAQARELAQPCVCGGRITIRGGSGAAPTAHCARCGNTWTEQGQAA